MTLEMFTTSVLVGRRLLTGRLAGVVMNITGHHAVARTTGR